jgi:hypothetical protein
VIDVLTTSGLSSMNLSIEPALDAVPPDSTLSFLSHDNRVSTEHLSAWFAVATGVGDAIEQSAPARTALVGACGTAARLTPECRARLFDGFGRRVLRRPLTETERAELTDLDDGTRPAAEALRAMVVVLLLSPSFLNQVEVDGTSRSAGAPLELTSWELASRLAFTSWRSTPDDALLDAAANGSLLTEAGFRAQRERASRTPERTGGCGPSGRSGSSSRPTSRGGVGGWSRRETDIAAHPGRLAISASALAAVACSRPGRRRVLLRLTG